jgi:hypothetical protein
MPIGEALSAAAGAIVGERNWEKLCQEGGRGLVWLPVVAMVIKHGWDEKWVDLIFNVDNGS